MKRELLDNGNIWQKSDGRWIGMVRYKDEYGVTQRKSFSSKKKKTLQAKMTEYVKNFQEQTPNSDEARKPLKESMKNWLRVYKFPEVERTTYDRYECTAEHQIYPYIGNKPVGDVTPADIKKLLTKHMNAGYAFTTSKKAYSILKMYFKQMYQEGAIPNNPMALTDMTKKDNYLAAQNKESKPQCDLVVVFTDEELDQIKAEAFKRFTNGKPVYQQAAAYFLMLNTGLRAGELCGMTEEQIAMENNQQELTVNRLLKENNLTEDECIWVTHNGKSVFAKGERKSAGLKFTISFNFDHSINNRIERNINSKSSPNVVRDYTRNAKITVSPLGISLSGECDREEDRCFISANTDGKSKVIMDDDTVYYILVNEGGGRRTDDNGVFYETTYLQYSATEEPAIDLASNRIIIDIDKIQSVIINGDTIYQK